MGDVGTMFYIILRGEVGVIIPTPYEIECTSEELYIFCIKNLENIDWNKFTHGDSIK